MRITFINTQKRVSIQTLPEMSRQVVGEADFIEDELAASSTKAHAKKLAQVVGEADFIEPGMSTPAADAVPATAVPEVVGEADFIEPELVAPAKKAPAKKPARVVGEADFIEPGPKKTKTVVRPTRVLRSTSAKDGGVQGDLKGRQGKGGQHAPLGGTAFPHQGDFKTLNGSVADESWGNIPEPLLKKRTKTRSPTPPPSPAFVAADTARPPPMPPPPAYTTEDVAKFDREQQAQENYIHVLHKSWEETQTQTGERRSERLDHHRKRRSDTDGCGAFILTLGIMVFFGWLLFLAAPNNTTVPEELTEVHDFKWFCPCIIMGNMPKTYHDQEVLPEGAFDVVPKQVPVTREQEGIELKCKHCVDVANGAIHESFIDAEDHQLIIEAWQAQGFEYIKSAKVAYKDGTHRVKRLFQCTRDTCTMCTPCQPNKAGAQCTEHKIKKPVTTYETRYDYAFNHRAVVTRYNELSRHPKDRAYSTLPSDTAEGNLACSTCTFQATRSSDGQTVFFERDRFEQMTDLLTPGQAVRVAIKKGWTGTLRAK